MDTNCASTDLQLLRDSLHVLLRDYRAVYGDGDLEMQPAIYQAAAALASVGGGK